MVIFPLHVFSSMCFPWVPIRPFFSLNVRRPLTLHSTRSCKYIVRILYKILYISTISEKLYFIPMGIFDLHNAQNSEKENYVLLWNENLFMTDQIFTCFYLIRYKFSQKSEREITIVLSTQVCRSFLFTFVYNFDFHTCTRKN